MKGLYLALSVEDFSLLIQYVFYVTIILICFVLIGMFKKKDKNRLTLKEVRSLCCKAKAFAEKIRVKKIGTHVIASPQLSKLASMVTEPTWLALRIVEEKRDIDFNGIVFGLDVLASQISEKSLDSFMPADEFEDFMREITNKLDVVIGSLDEIARKRF